ncbi:hypothetical protein CHU98_g6733 [Xylaria longipes]|nr:hypothetical protein CHU98_g6733 [Xylaria longipes]
MDIDLLSTGSNDSYTKESLQLLVCPKCDVKYPNIHELLTHQESEMHFACNQCKSCFWTEGGLQDHKRKNHRPDLDLECFGCNSHFSRAGRFWQHLESGECEVILPADIARGEESHIKGDDTWASYSEGETTPTESVVTPDFPSRPVPIAMANAHPLHYRSEDFPVLPIKQKALSTPGFRGEQKGNFWSNRRAAVPQTSNSTSTYNAVAPPASYDNPLVNTYKNSIQKPVPNNSIRVVQAPASPAEGEPHVTTFSRRIVDPNEPGYNPNVFYNEILKKSVCPHKSSSLIAHMETTKTCPIRETDGFQRALGQITGGIMDFHTRSGMFVIDKNSVQELFELRSQSMMGLKKKEMKDFDAYDPKQLKYWEDDDSSW